MTGFIQELEGQFAVVALGEITAEPSRHRVSAQNCPCTARISRPLPHALVSSNWLFNPSKLFSISQRRRYRSASTPMQS